MKVFASSDHHFYHKNIIKYAERPFDFEDENCVIDNAKLMIERHNSVVSNDDIALLVGDLSAGLRGRQDHFQQLLALLNGKKILVRGNHDHQPDEFYKEAGFIDVVEYFKIPPYFINHYPCYSSKWTKGPEKAMMFNVNSNGYHTIIHGHVHQRDPAQWESDGYYRKNVCVDFPPNDYYPQELTQREIVNFFEKNYG
jgi:calcineurin-like phosphoesterase family protein